MESFESRRERLDWISEYAQLYHSKRRDFLDKAAKLDPILSLVFGSAAFGTAVADFLWASASAALVITIYSAASLSFGFGRCAEKHQEILRKWGAFRKKLLAVEAPDHAALLILEAESETIHEESPGQLLLLSAICEDEVRLARGQNAVLSVSPATRQLANFFSLSWEKYRIARENI